MSDPVESRYNTWEWRSLAAIAKQRASGCCEACGSDGPLDAHHIRPVGEGGPFWDLDNLRALCRKCHQRQHPGWGDRDIVGRALQDWIDDGVLHGWIDEGERLYAERIEHDLRPYLRDGNVENKRPDLDDMRQGIQEARARLRAEVETVRRPSTHAATTLQRQPAAASRNATNPNEQTRSFWWAVVRIVALFIGGYGALVVGNVVLFGVLVGLFVGATWLFGVDISFPLILIGIPALLVLVVMYDLLRR